MAVGHWVHFFTWIITVFNIIGLPGFSLPTAQRTYKNVQTTEKTAKTWRLNTENISLPELSVYYIIRPTWIFSARSLGQLRSESIRICKPLRKPPKSGGWTLRTFLYLNYHSVLYNRHTCIFSAKSVGQLRSESIRMCKPLRKPPKSGGLTLRTFLYLNYQCIILLGLPGFSLPNL